MQNTPSSTSIINVPTDSPSIDVIKSKMDAVLYNAALEGSVEAIEPYKDSLTSQVTPSQNTVLHLHVGVPKSKGAIPNIQFIEKVLEYNNSLLLQKNDNGEIPLHLAARFGHIEAVKIFINPENRTSVECPAEILTTTDNNHDTALHLAARWGNVEIVEVLLQADDSYRYAKNNDNETPLYIAAERQHPEVVAKILKLCKSPAFEGPFGRTALHAAALYRDAGMLHEILKKNRSLLISKDDEGQTPLHYAASTLRRNIIGTFLKCISSWPFWSPPPCEILTDLLEYDDPSDSAVYIRDKKGRTALHLAVMYGGVQRIKPLIEHRSDCSEIRDINGQNLFHYAVNSGVLGTVKYLTSIGIFSKFINEKDKDGNTPLHLLSTSLSYAPLSYFYCMLCFLNDKDVDLMAFNRRNQTAGDIVYSLRTMKFRSEDQHIVRRLFVNITPRRIRSSLEEKPNESRLTEVAEEGNKYLAHVKKTSEVHIIVATLITTVSFAAGIAVPGGFDTSHGANQGTALLTRQRAFRVFMVSDSLALTFSATAILLHFHIAWVRDPKLVISLFYVSAAATILSLWAMMVAFMTGTYAILYPTSPSPAITILVIPAIFLGTYACGSLYSNAVVLFSYGQSLINCVLSS